MWRVVPLNKYKTNYITNYTNADQKKQCFEIQVTGRYENHFQIENYGLSGMHNLHQSTKNIVEIILKELLKCPFLGFN